ncbi:myb-related transcription factor, partner of profilin-like [Vombatus ursinus]|nr:myb-related transcription factor, partner of profilin-like [Vombatus ursinus]
MTSVTERKRKPKFSKDELDILVTEVTHNEAVLFGRETMRLSHADRDKIWEGIARKITSVSQVARSVKDIKHRWDDLKRRAKDKLAAMQKSLSGPGGGSHPPTIILTAHERATESSLHASHSVHGFPRADLNGVDSPSTSYDEDEETPGPSHQPPLTSLHQDQEEVARLARPALFHSLSSSNQSETVETKPEDMPPSSSQAPPHSHSQSPPFSGFDQHHFHSHAQESEPFQRFCQELVTVHRGMADSMHTIGQAMAELTGWVSQMCQMLSEIRDGVRALQQVPSLAPATDTPLQPEPHRAEPSLEPTPPSRTTRSRKRKHHF